MKVLSIECPDCGKTLKVTVEMDEKKKTEIIRKTSTPTTWSEIANKIKEGKAEEFLSVGDIVPFEMKDGQKTNAVVAEINVSGENAVAFVIEDCLKDKHEMNEDGYNKGGWRDSDMREYLNGEVYDLLPDDLKSVIVPRQITQVLDGEELNSEDKLWLLSKTEIGEESEVDKNDVHFSLFKDERSRVKQLNGETWFWWLRSPYHTSSNPFWVVYANGNGHYYYANLSYGVAFGFLIK